MVGIMHSVPASFMAPSFRHGKRAPVGWQGLGFIRANAVVRSSSVRATWSLLSSRRSAKKGPPRLATGVMLAGQRLFPTALPSEQEALMAFASGTEEDCILVDKAVSTLRKAAPPNTSVPPVEVEGAMAYLEIMRETCGEIPGFTRKGEKLLADLAGDWRLHFSTFSKTFPYLPLKEIVRLDTDAKSIAVINRVGPLTASFISSILFTGTSCEFGFETIEVELFGQVVLQRNIAERKMKWYNFYYTDDTVSCVRSSTGALTLLFREPIA